MSIFHCFSAFWRRFPRQRWCYRPKIHENPITISLDLCGHFQPNLSTEFWVIHIYVNLSLFFLISAVVPPAEVVLPQKNTRKPNRYWFGLVLKFSAKSVHRVLSNTHLCQFLTVFPHFGGGSAGGGTAEKIHENLTTIGMNLCWNFQPNSSTGFWVIPIYANFHCFSSFRRRFRRRRRWYRQKEYMKTLPLLVWTCVEIFSQICPQGFE